MAGDFTALTLDVVDGVARATLDRPERGNAFDQVLCDELGLLAERCEADDVRCLLVRATGRWFSTGGDLARLGADRDDAPAFVRRATGSLHPAVARLARMDAPVVVAMRGGAIGAGALLAALADFCLVTDRVRFLAGYPALGLTVDGGLSYLLPRRVGTRAAAEFFLRNATWSAQQALDLGLVSRLVDDADLDEEAETLAAELAAGPTAAYGEVRRLLLDAWERPLEEHLAAETEALARAIATTDGWNGVSDALAGRPPTFSGR